MIRQPNDMVPQRSVRLLAGCVIVASVIASGHLTFAGLVDPAGLGPGGDTTAARTYAAYVAIRSLVLLGALIWLRAVRAWRSLGLVFALNAAVQIGDAAIGVAHQQVAQTLGPAVFAVLLLWAARPLGGLTWRPGEGARDLPSVPGPPTPRASAR
jgi:hypothetical protein